MHAPRSIPGKAAGAYARLLAAGLLLVSLTPAAPARAQDGPCPEGTVESLPDGSVVCTHGPDPAPVGQNPAEHRSVAELKPTNAAAVTAQVPCIGDGQDGARVQLVYAVASDRPDRRGEYIGVIRGWAAEMNAAMEESARRTGGARQIRFVTTADCLPDVRTLQLSPAQDDSFGGVVAALRAVGHTRDDRRYLVFVDGESSICGIGELAFDLSDGGLAGAVFNGCGGAHTALHELLHTLGAVQLDAPNSNGRFHCTDDADVMCYSEPGAPPLRQVCPPENENLLDCNHDDYFHTSPPAGSYLAGRLNVADSPFLEGSGAPPPPPGPANDRFGDAEPLSGERGRTTGTTEGATREDGEPALLGQGQASIWYRWTAPESGTLTLSTSGSGFDTVLGVFAGDSLGTLQLIAENDDAVGGTVTSRVDVPVDAGHSYAFAVDGWAGAKGPVVLDWQLVPDSGAPPNDEVTDALELTGAAGSVTGSNEGATKALDEPFHADNAGGASVWYRWTASHSGVAEFTTAGSAFDTLLAVYERDEASNLTLLGASDDTSGASGLHSTVRWDVIEGTSYWLALDGWGGAQGVFTLAWSMVDDVDPEPDPDEDTSSGREFRRISGRDRYETAARLSAEHHTPGAYGAFVTSGENFADVPAAVPASVTFGAPLLLSTAGDLPPSTTAELARLSPGLIVIVGGSTAVSTRVEDELRHLAPPGELFRAAGADRYETAAILADWSFDRVETVFVTNGHGFADAVAAASVASAWTMPLLLTDTHVLPDATARRLERLDPARIVVVGGPRAVAPSVVARLDDFAPVTVLAGRDRYETAAELATWAFPDGSSEVLVATGHDWPDAMAGARTGLPVLLTPPDQSPPRSVRDALATLDPETVTVLGGHRALPAWVVDALRLR